MTLGCRWQEKSFSVVVNKEKPLNICKCGAEIYNIQYLFNGETFCKSCFSKLPKLNYSIELGFNTAKDKLYEFIDYKNFKQPTEVRSKGHWKKLLKQHGLIDDVKGIKEPEPPKIDRRFIADEINKELQEKGLRHKLIRRK